jgi:hypothetical protein
MTVSASGVMKVSGSMMFGSSEQAERTRRSAEIEQTPRNMMISSGKNLREL